MTSTLPVLSQRFSFIGCALGIFICYFLFGIVQEKITRGRYGKQLQKDGSEGERFTCSFALVWVQCFCNMIFAKGANILSSIYLFYLRLH